jgi:hypothetical protein
MTLHGAWAHQYPLPPRYDLRFWLLSLGELDELPWEFMPPLVLHAAVAITASSRLEIR